MNNINRMSVILMGLITFFSVTNMLRAKEGEVSMNTTDTFKIEIAYRGSILYATLQDNPTTRDFVAQLPLEIELEDYAGTEKIFYLLRKLTQKDAPAGYSASAGDITYYSPWGNLAIFYKDFGYANGLIHLGKIENEIDLLKIKSTEKARITVSNLPSRNEKTAPEDTKTLIVYYSWSGNTRHIAGKIQQQTGGTLFELKPVNEYPRSYGACVDVAKKEIDTEFTPELKAMPENLDSYDTIFVGSPIWWHTLASPVLSFIKNNDLSGKTIIPFCTHGGGGQGKFSQDVARFCRKSVILDELVLFDNGGSTADSEISEWLKRLNSK